MTTPPNDPANGSPSDEGSPNEPPPWGQQPAQYPPPQYPPPQYPPSAYPQQPPPYPAYPQPNEYGFVDYQRPDYASWWRRVGAWLLDGLIVLPIYVVQSIVQATTSEGSDTSWWEDDLSAMSGIGVLLYLVLQIAALGVQIWNRCYRAGRTGQSLGKTWTGTHLVFEATGQPIGPWRAFGRELLHILDAICLIGFIYAAFDDKRQTFADKIMKTIVVRG